MSMHQAESFRRLWLYPMLALAAVAVVMFTGLYVVDVVATGGPAAPGGNGLGDYFLFDQDHITDAVSGLGAMVAAVLGIVVTVVSIVVQLSADRYTGVTSMFLRDRTNLLVMAYYVVTCVCGVWVSLSLRSEFVPRLTLVFMLLLTVVGLVMMAPYFGYVFRFLEPANIIRRIQRDATRTAEAGAQDGADLSEAQARSLAAMEELSDITSNSISGKDKIIASRAVDALKDLAVRYLDTKPRAKPAWFEIGAGIRGNPDFVAMDPESLRDLEQRKTWFEWKVMRQYLGIYNEALSQMRDINYLIAIDTRYIGEKAADAKDDELIGLVFRFMNSYMRSTLNAKDVRTAYNVLNQYRLLVESLLAKKRDADALTAVRYLKYYAMVSYDLKLSFVTETIAYDVGAVCQLAHELRSGVEDDLLALFLEIDRPDMEHAHDVALKGVRKAQVKLASYYLEAGADDRVTVILNDMASESRERLRAIRDELFRVESKDFWEIIDRGRNFEFMPEGQRRAMISFFGRFEGLDDGPAQPRPSMASRPA
ncbi:MAG: DUF2254 domain-containing protein [Polyangiaceae bacterium]|nr:DUF2254 domain-containing protein [Polyangiaceae bacterium]